MPTVPHLSGKAQQPPMSEPNPAELTSMGSAVATGSAAGARDLEANINPGVNVGDAPAVLPSQGQRWLAENADALLSSNAYVERCGLPLEVSSLLSPGCSDLPSPGVLQSGSNVAKFASANSYVQIA